MRFGMSALTCVALSFSGASHGQTIDDFISEQKVTPSDGTASDYFGYSVSISGDFMVIGADGNDNGFGSAYIYERAGDGTWSEVARLTASDGAEIDLFGSTVSISGDTALIGARLDDDNGSASGSAYVFDRDEFGVWSETAKLTASDGAATDYFGWAVSISGETIVVGAYGDDDDGSSSGSAYVFERDGAGTWSETAKLTASDGAAVDNFGRSVSISGETVVAGAYGNDDNASTAGSAYVFERDGNGDWLQTEKLTASDWSSNKRFGWAVSISGETIVVGAYGDADNGLWSGATYVFERDAKGTWSETTKLTASDGAMLDNFGASVSISDDTVAVGANQDDDNGGNSGSVYIFERDGAGTWSETSKQTASDGAAEDNLGHGVSISGETVVVGAWGDDDNGGYSGSAYVFENYSVLNLDYANKGYTSLEAALEETVPTDRLAVRSSAFNVDGILNTASMPLTFIAVEPIEIVAGLMFLPADGTSFTNSDDVEAAGYSLSGSLIAPQSGALIFSDLGLGEGGELVQDNASLFIYGDMNNEAGLGYLSGTIFADEGDVTTAVNGTNRVAGDTRFFSDYINAGTTIIQEGILYIYGDLVNTGTLSGEYNNGFAGGGVPEPGDGFNIGGSYTVGQSATLSMPDPVWWLRVAGDLDVAIDNPMNFGMSEATIELNGLAAGKVQAFEAMSADLGADEAGFDPSNFPIGTLRIGGDSNAQVVNNHANSTGAACEVVYVDELLVEAGGYLATGGCTIYTRSATINGEVDDPDSIVIVEDAPPCLGDLTGDGEVNGADLGLMIAMWGTPDGDLTGDGMTNGADLGLLIASWGLCN
ncbi:MAG: hypothetical protein MK085_04330 [Phycisphaerales bacterium]|nr:hypothetical protein [Phycisphaerales bacterium]